MHHLSLYQNLIIVRWRYLEKRDLNKYLKSKKKDFFKLLSSKLKLKLCQIKKENKK